MSTKDLMARMGHDDMRAALIYQRATSDADRLIADRLSALVDAHPGRRSDPDNDDDGDDDGPLAPWFRSRSCCAVAAAVPTR